MDAARQRYARIAGALEELATQEAAAVAANDFTAVAGLQARAAPLIDFLVTNAAPVPSADLRATLAHVSARRHATAQCLARQLTRIREEMRELKMNHGRLARVAPAYGRGGSVPERRFVAVG